MIQHDTKEFEGSVVLQRRDFSLGWVQCRGKEALPEMDQVIDAWENDRSIQLSGIVDTAAVSADIKQAHELMERVLESEGVVDFIEASPYVERLSALPLISVSGEEHDKQGIEKIYFDAESDGEVLAESLWCKASWLSFCDEDASMRFRFSFGMEGFEDVAADPLRQHWAGVLCDAIFPESRAITENEKLLGYLQAIFKSTPEFVERIVYFNAPNGGAQMHHDVERGHAGVVYAQMSGSTFWLALSKPKLRDELFSFVYDERYKDALHKVLPDSEDREKMLAIVSDRQALSDYMDEPDHELVEAVLDRSDAFIGYLVGRGYAHCLAAGDVLLMSQKNLETCVWHCVFCLGEEPGEGLSFAVRTQRKNK